MGWTGHVACVGEITTYYLALMMEAASSSETSVNISQTTRCYIPEDSHLHTRRRDNPKFHFVLKGMNISKKSFLVEFQRASFAIY
jgi:hypothetical protein